MLMAKKMKQKQKANPVVQRKQFGIPVGRRGDGIHRKKISGTFWKRRRVALDQNVYYC